MILDIQKNLSESVRAAVKAAFDVPLDSVTFQYPPRPELGDLAITAPFDLAKTLRRKPREVAERLSADLGRRRTACARRRWRAAATSTSS